MHSTFGYRSQLGKYETVDEDELLATLTAEELRELERELVDLEPDDAVPIGLRQKDHTTSTPDSLSTDTLQNYWDNDSHYLLHDKDMVERSQTDKREVAGVTWDDDLSPALRDADRSIQRDSSSQVGRSGGKQKEHFHVNSSHLGHREVTRGPCMFKGPENRNIIPNPNLNTALRQIRGNPVVMDEVLELVVANEACLSEVNLNNADNVSMETLVRLAEALISNTHVRVFSLANTRADDRVASSVAHMLHENSTVTTVNMDSNYISGGGILALMASLRHNRTLEELRFHNQRHMCGSRVEMEMVRVLRDNTTLLKLGYHFELPGPRMNATCLLTRNQDLQRQQRRLQQQHTTQSHCVSAQPGDGHSRCDEETDSSSASGPSLTSATPQPPQPHPSQSGPNSSPPSRQIAQMVRQHEGSSFATEHTGKPQPQPQPQPQPKRAVAAGAAEGLVEKREESILHNSRLSLRPASVRRTKEAPVHHQSAHSDLMEAIRSSSIHSLRKGT